MNAFLATGLAALVFAAIHVLSPRLVFLDRRPRSIWLSVAGGVSTAYVFVHLLPELAALQAALSHPQDWISETAVYLTALAGMVAFYGLEQLVRRDSTRREERASSPGTYRLHLGSFALYNFLIAYLLEEQLREGGMEGLALYAFALGLHYVVNDRALYAHHGPRYLRTGRWVLAGAVIVGWLAAQTLTIPEALTIYGIALLAGGVILNVIKEELPQERESRFWAFALGAAGYGGLLLVA